MKLKAQVKVQEAAETPHNGRPIVKFHADPEGKLNKAFNGAQLRKYPVLIAHRGRCPVLPHATGNRPPPRRGVLLNSAAALSISRIHVNTTFTFPRIITNGVL